MLSLLPPSILRRLPAVVLAAGLPFAAAAAPLDDALAAARRGDVPAALRLLQPLAEAGSPEAAFNLALLARNRPGQVPAASDRWLKQAARAGLVEAYLQLQPEAVRPAPGTHIEIALSPADWVGQQNPKHYTLQLASSTRLSKIEKYYTQYRLTGQAGIYHYRRDGRDWYALVYGAYPNAGAAKAAIGNLPEELRKWSPWVRRFGDIQKKMLPIEAS